jgi:hypothetical protein
MSRKNILYLYNLCKMLIYLGSDDDSDGLGGPITRSKTKRREEAYKKQLELESRPDAKTAKWLKRIDDDEARWKPTS